MKVLVCGSRTWTDGIVISRRLRGLPNDAVIIHGGASGADLQAERVAAKYHLASRCFPAEWNRYGKRAGIIRNLAMLDEQPDLVLAFWDGRSRGTKHTIDEARKRGIPVEVIES